MGRARGERRAQAGGARVLQGDALRTARKEITQTKMILLPPPLFLLSWFLFYERCAEDRVAGAARDAGVVGAKMGVLPHPLLAVALVFGLIFAQWNACRGLRMCESWRQSLCVCRGGLSIWIFGGEDFVGVLDEVDVVGNVVEVGLGCLPVFSFGPLFGGGCPHFCSTLFKIWLSPFYQLWPFLSYLEFVRWRALVGVSFCFLCVLQWDP
ncbi:hypothetical protein SUGI_0988680 [Cryptomeria japonica]|nr:hypothetical protein SUGI_0988680 [Cryptomeria japonica]